jgi:hypothetical protein
MLIAAASKLSVNAPRHATNTITMEAELTCGTWDYSAA